MGKIANPDSKIINKQGKTLLEIGRGEEDNRDLIFIAVEPDAGIEEDNALFLVELIKESFRQNYVPFQKYQRNYHDEVRGHCKRADFLKVPIEYRKMINQIVKGAIIAARPHEIEAKFERVLKVRRPKFKLVHNDGRVVFPAVH